MRRRFQAGWYAAVALSILVFNIYRAWMQSITYDEAITYLDFVATPFAQTMHSYDANHHVLHTLLCKLSVAIFGLGELSLRTPSLLGGALFLAACAALCFSELVPGPASWAAYPMLVLNPFVLDYLSIARGYGLALGFFAAGLYCAVRALRDPARRKRWFSTISLLLGLAVSSNLTLVFPSVALMLALFLISWSQGKLRVSNASMLLFPGAALFVLICGAPLLEANGSHFYVGVQRLRDSLDSIGSASAFYARAQLGIAGTPDGVTPAQWKVLNALWKVAKVLVVWAGLLVLYHFIKRARAKVDALKTPTSVIAGLVLLLTLGLVFTTHQFLGLRYPVSRTGLYLAFLFTFFLVVILFGSPRVPSFLHWIAAAAAAAVSLYWVSQLQTESYLEWRYNAATKSMLAELARRGPVPGHTAHGISATWMLVPSIRFYKLLYPLDWSGSLDINGTLSTRDDATRPNGIDYFLLLPEDHRLIQRWRLQSLRTDQPSGAVLAVIR